MAVNIAIMSYRELTALIKRLNYQPPAGVEILIIDALLEDALQLAKAMEQKEEIDVFVSAGANGYLLSQNLKTPLVVISVTGFDFLLALAKLQPSASPIGIITYRQKLPYLDQVLNTLQADLRQVTYSNFEDLDAALDDLREQGVSAVIGGSLVIEKARSKGMQGIFIYSEDGVLRALDAAIKIGLTKKAEAEKAEELRTIINFAHEGIIATDKHGVITVFNPSAEKITGISRQSVIGRLVSEVIPSTGLNRVVETRQPELSQIQTIGNVKILTNRIPIITKGEVTGAVATFQDIGAIQKAEEKIREGLYQKGFIAKTTFADIVGQSEIMAEVKKKAVLYAKSDSTILILGETGTGKELFAQAIHNESARCKRPFVAINCAALPANLLESELFGYEEGAFTGAKKGGKPGLFELAHGGTIFLDEIGEVPMAIQSRLLRVLQEHEVLRIGGERIIPVNIRVIAATNKDLWDMVKQGLFREDLYYRLCVLEIHLPPLRQRRVDIPLLITKFLQGYRKDLPPEVIQKIAGHPLLSEYQWPGNIRELHNFVERFAVLHADNSPVDKTIEMILGEKVQTNKHHREKEVILQLLAETKGNKSETARRLGISRTTLWRKLRE